MNPIRVVFISNYALVTAGFRDILESTGAIQVVGESAVAPSAVDLARQLAPDVLILDVSSDDAQYRSIIDLVRHEMPRVRIIALSDDENSAFALPLLQSGVLGYLTLRDAAQELDRAISAVMQGQAFLCSSASSALVKGYRTKARARNNAAGSQI